MDIELWNRKFAHRVHYVPVTGCWLFDGCWTSAGYGNVGHECKNWLAHRLSYTLLVGEIGDGILCHKCDTPACINPDHVFVGSFSDNSRDMIRKGRTPIVGETQWKARLTEKAVREIRKSSLTDTRLAEMLGVCRATVTLARNGKTWGWVAA